MDKTSCLVCDEKAEMTCPGCGIIGYCSQQHLKEGQINHKLVCKPYIISSNNEWGRFLMASRNIKMGEVIFQEKPLIFGPGEDDTVPICYSCGGVPSERCKNCNVALTCGSSCQGNAHFDLECVTYKAIAKKYKHNNFLSNRIVLPLRCLLFLKESEGEWKKFFTLESHKEKRRDTQIWMIYNKTIIKVFQNWGIISQSKPDEEKVQDVMGVLDVNSFGVRCGLQGQGRALYLDAAMMAHDCFSNCHLAVDDNFVMTAYARQEILNGQPILYNYTNPLHGTAVRQEHLLETKYFSCHCQRCQDPTELGTHLSSLHCPRCRKGLIVINNKHVSWTCLQCKHDFNNGLVDATLQQVLNLTEDLNKNDINEMEKMIVKLSKTLYVNHSLLIDLKQQLAALYREQKQTIQTLNRRQQLCQDLLFVLQILEPGISRLRGITLYELHSISLGLSQLKNDDMKLMQEAEGILKEAVSLLLHEPPRSPEGRLARQALAQLKDLRENIQKTDRKGKKKSNKIKN